MNPAVFALLAATGAILVAVYVARGLVRGGFARDAFPTPARRNAAVGLLVVVLLVCVVTPFSTGLSGAQFRPSQLRPATAFALHAIFAAFLAAYYLLSARGSLLDFLRLRSSRPWRDLLSGLPVAGFAWAVSAAGMLAIQLVARHGAPAAERAPVSPVIPWLVAQSPLFKAGIVLSAMVVEEIFFRSFLQPRIGAVGATLFFTVAHGVYGQPAMLVGILILAVVLAAVFEIYGNALPGIIAHGAFDAFELFVLIPFALKFAGA